MVEQARDLVVAAGAWDRNLSRGRFRWRSRGTVVSELHESASIVLTGIQNPGPRGARILSTKDWKGT